MIRKSRRGSLGLFVKNYIELAPKLIQSIADLNKAMKEFGREAQAMFIGDGEPEIIAPVRDVADFHHKLMRGITRKELTATS